MVKQLWFLSFITLIKATFSLDLPIIELSSIGGQLGFIGDYAGLSPFQQNTQFESLSQNALIISDNSSIFQLFASITNGSVESYCALSDTQIILAGNFTSINNTVYNNIALFDITTRSISGLQQGLDGAVKSLMCFNQTTVYVGGDFIAPVGNSSSNQANYTGHVALFSGDSWSPLPWKGFNGPVNSIIYNQPQESILFAGQFNSTGDGQFIDNQTTAQPINLFSYADISSGNGALSGDYANPQTVVCSSTPWLLQDGVPGYWEAQLSTPAQPSVFRLKNANVDGSNTRCFNIISLGSNAYFELSYIDPITNTVKTCAEECPLSNDSSIAYQDFTVLSTITTNAIRINIDSWYGLSGGLGGVQMFRADTTLQPILSNYYSNTNTSLGSCYANGTTTTAPQSTATAIGNWTLVYSFQAYRNFLVASIPASDIATSDVSVLYQPYIPGQGLYDVYFTTPGCVGTSDCDGRTMVDLTINLSPGNISTLQLDQAIDADTRTLVYSGLIFSSIGTFQPTITMTFSNSTTSTSTTLSMLADSAEFIRSNQTATLSSVLNYYPNNNTWVPLSTQLPSNAIVETMQLDGNNLYIGGYFTNTTFSNIVTYNFNNNGLAPLSFGGLNGQVLTSLLVGSKLIVGGLFNNTINVNQTTVQEGLLSNVAIYDTQSNTWSSMNNGVNNIVTNLYTTDNTTVHLSGSFTQALSDNVTQLYNNAQWDLSNNQWIQSTSFILGPVYNQVLLPNNSILYLGDILSAQTYRAENVASFSGTSPSYTSPITQLDPNAKINAGVIWTSNNSSTDSVILAGSFIVDSTTFPVAIYQNNSWTGLFNNITGNITTLYILHDQLLLMGGQFSGYINNSLVTSFAMYNLTSQQILPIIGLYNDPNGSNPGQVNVIIPDATGQNIYVAGNFSYAGLLNCNSICKVMVATRQWNDLNQGISGNIQDVALSSDGSTVTVVGNLQITGNSGSVILAVSDTTSNSPWKAANTSINSTVSKRDTNSNNNDVSISSLLHSDNDNLITSGEYANGSSYLATWNGQTFTPLNLNLGPNTSISQLLYIPVSSSPSKNRYPEDSNTMLMAVGQLNVSGFGSSSVALYDGAVWYPYLLTSTADGNPGTLYRTLTISSCCTAMPSSTKHHLSVAAIILISIGISLGIIFLLVLCVFLVAWFRRRNQVEQYSDPMQEWKPKYRPMSLLAMVDAANLNKLSSQYEAEGSSSAAAAAVASSSRNNRRDPATSAYSTAVENKRTNNAVDLGEGTLFNRNGTLLHSPNIPGVPFGVMVARALEEDKDVGDASRQVYYTKFLFEAKEHGELSFGPGVPIVVTDKSDDVWWMGYKDGGNETPVCGVFPKSYVTKARPV